MYIHIYCTVKHTPYHANLSYIYIYVCIYIIQYIFAHMYINIYCTVKHTPYHVRIGDTMISNTSRLIGLSDHCTKVSSLMCSSTSWCTGRLRQPSRWLFVVLDLLSATLEREDFKRNTCRRWCSSF